MKTVIKIIPHFIILMIFFLFLQKGAIAQTNIAKQSFEASGDTWIPMTLSTPACTNGSDRWDYSTSLNSITPNEGAQFWGIQDLNGTCGGATFETITLPNIDVSSYNNVVFSFTYNVIGYDNGDDMKYELFYDNVSQGEVVFVNGASNFTSNDWDTISVNIPNTVTNVKVVLSVKQNGGSDYGGLDNVTLVGSPINCVAATEPITNASNINFTLVGCDSYTINWTNGDGAKRIVVMSANPVVGTPTDQVGYTANATFGSGATIATNEFVVYNGTGSSASVNGLNVNTIYYVAVFEYNGTAQNCEENYLITNVLNGSQSTLAVCTPPLINSILVNSCGVSAEEGVDEYVVFKNGSSALFVNDIRIDFPSGGSYCNTVCGSNTIGNNASYLNQLNTTANCGTTKFVYQDPIQPNTTVILFTGNPPNYAYDFSSMCGGEQVAVLFCNNTALQGRFANSANGSRSTTMTWGTATQTVTYYSSTANTGTNGDFADFDAVGNVSYSNSGTCEATPLPIKLAYFEIDKTTDNFVAVEWKTFNEVNNAFFVVEKSKDLTYWEIVEEVEGAGFSTEEQFYNLIDAQPYNGTSYYRLKQIDFDGQEEIFRPEAITLSIDKPIFVYPNPASERIFVETNSVILNIKLHNLLGNEIPIAPINTDGGSIYFDVSSITNGIYILSVTLGNGSIENTKIKINH